jgi:putative ABC transport system ATP-binding protein
MNATTLQVEALAKVYDGPEGPVRALGGVSLTVAPGELVVVQGPSGCGKTTLLLSAGGLLRPTRGRVLVDGQDPYALAPGARADFRARHVGFVFQQFHLIPYLSVRDNILAPALAVRGGGENGRVDELIEIFGLRDRAAHRPSALSTGERQRVALARSVLNRPEVLLADEPTGNLDPDNAQVVLDFLRSYARGGGTVLLVTHSATSTETADRVVRLRGGTISDR